MEALFSNIQNFCGEVHESACYSFCLLKVGDTYNKEHKINTEINVLSVLRQACENTSKNSIIYFNDKNYNDNDNFYVQHPDLLLTKITGKKWTVTKSYDLSYKPKKNEYVISYYERVKTGSVVGHFDINNFPITDSQTKKYGKLHSIRICKVID